MCEDQQFIYLRLCEEPFDRIIPKGGKITFVEVGQREMPSFNQNSLHHPQEPQLIGIVGVLLDMRVEACLGTTPLNRGRGCPMARTGRVRHAEASTTTLGG